MGNNGNLDRGSVNGMGGIHQRIADPEKWERQPASESAPFHRGKREHLSNRLDGLLWEEASGFASPLTRRERQILNYMAQGCLNKQIADILGISEQTIKNHVSSILGKLGACRRTEAVVAALRQGLLSLEEVGSSVG